MVVSKLRVCACVFSICALLCAGTALATGSDGQRRGDSDKYSGSHDKDDDDGGHHDWDDGDDHQQCDHDDGGDHEQCDCKSDDPKDPEEPKDPETPTVPTDPGDSGNPDSPNAPTVPADQGQTDQYGTRIFADQGGFIEALGQTDPSSLGTGTSNTGTPNALGADKTVSARLAGCQQATHANGAAPLWLILFLCVGLLYWRRRLDKRSFGTAVQA